MHDPRRKRVRHTANEDENEEEGEQERRPRKKQKSSYDPFSDDPTPQTLQEEAQLAIPFVTTTNPNPNHSLCCYYLQY